MPIVTVDDKGRIQLPREVREAWSLKPKQRLAIEVKPGTLVITKAGKPTPETDPLLRDIMLNPARTKVKVTRTLLRKLKDETWTP